MKGKKIAHIITSLDSGGAERMLLKLILERKKNGFQDVVISLKRPGVIQNLFHENGITVINLQIKGLTSFILSLRRMKTVIYENKIVLFQTWLYHADFFGSILSLLYRVPVIWNIRCSITDMKSTTKIVLSILKIMSFYFPKKIIYASFSGKESHEKYGFDKKRSIVISNGFELKENPLKVNKSKIIIGSVGRFHEDKDFKTLVQASKYVLKEFPETTFVLIGKDLDNENKDLLELLERFDVKKAFVLKGFMKNTASEYGTFDIYCSSSKSEGFPNVIGEAMAFKVPIVSTDAGDSSYLIGDSGFVVPIGDSKKLAEKINLLIAMSAEERLELGNKGFLRIKQNFQISQIMNLYNDLYNNVIN